MTPVARGLAIAALFIAPLVAEGQSEAHEVPLPGVHDVSDFTFSGVVDVSYDWADVDGPPGLHAFDVNQDTFSLHQVNLTATKTFEDGVGATVNTVFGDDAAVYSEDGVDFDLTQGFITYDAGDLTFVAGRFVTLAGYETINPALNPNASRGLLFYFQPLLHTGVRAVWHFADGWTLTGGVNNGLVSGFQTQRVDNNTDKTLEAQVAYDGPGMAFRATAYSGDEDTAPTGGAHIRSQTFDVVAGINLDSGLNLGVNGDYFAIDDGTGGTIDRMGVAGYAHMHIGKWRTAVRLEYLDLDSGAGSSFWYREWTLTGGYSLSSHFDVLTEIRHDEVDEQAAPIAPLDSGNDQYTATAKAIFKF